MQKLNKHWFEFVDRRKQQLARKAWIPIYGSFHPIVAGEYPKTGYLHDQLAVASAVIYKCHRPKAEEYDWTHWAKTDTVANIDENNNYVEADSVLSCYNEVVKIGFRLVFSQYFNSDHPKQVSLHQDFMSAYGLLKEGNEWIRPNEGYEVVARISNDGIKTKNFLTVRAEYLRDYLSARNAILRLYCYSRRVAIMEEDPKFDWSEDTALPSDPHFKCFVGCTRIDESGFNADANWNVTSVRRTDVDVDEEIPDYSNTNEENLAWKSEVVKGSEEKLKFKVCGEMFRGEWIEPASQCCRIAGKDQSEELLVIIDGSGEKFDLKSLREETIGRYLWFKPSVMSALTEYRGSSLAYFTAEIGVVKASPDCPVDFGVNELGFVNAYAFDIACLPFWQRQIWVTHNCRPDGSVSQELQKFQMECVRPRTVAPEILFRHSLLFVDTSFRDRFGFALLRGHQDEDTLLSYVHRFRVNRAPDLQSLAKDIFRVSIDRITKDTLLRALGEENSKLGTLRLLERLLAQYTTEEYAHSRLTPIVGLKELRNADAHFIGTNVEDCLAKIQIDAKLTLVSQASSMIEKIANAFFVIGDVFSDRSSYADSIE